MPHQPALATRAHLRHSGSIMFRRTSLCLALACLLAAPALFSQTAASPAFEVASVKPSSLDMMKLAQQVATSGQIPRIGVHVDAARAEYIFMGLKELIVEAYKVKATQVTGPDWLNSLAGQRFDIIAKMPEGSTKDQAPQMLQALLAERFKLAVHRENKEGPVMALVVGKGGPKLVASPEGSDFDENTPLKPGETEMESSEGKVRIAIDMKTGTTVTNMGKRGTWTQSVDRSTGMLHYEGSRMTMGTFADMLTAMTQLTGGPATQVVDMTGLKGFYVVKLDLSMADLMKMVQALGVAVPGQGGDASRGLPADAASDPGGSSTMFEWVRALGLNLESRKAPVDRLVVDHAEKMPTEN
jgi:uncharacterized protein (TIGR03435 family)